MSNPYSDSVRSVDELRVDGGFDGSKQISFGDSVFCDLLELPIDMICHGIADDRYDPRQGPRGMAIWGSSLCACMAGHKA
ncbi:hypothetical protein LOK49_LG04G01114 [Camellia lanceoleosa]|uniref:Uncharacterized protein n=1 Tax=Camellia lanceoleosa TaxID=1840588 RepID=A0ACC0HY41_9ERIC|nr:hypothetical protein LOK49_LG04G01114 [Camellia lanceoleosa]